MAIKQRISRPESWDEEVSEGVAQAKNYAGKLAIRHTYSTDGQGIYGIDMKTGKEGDVPRFHTPDELWTLVFASKNTWHDRFAAIPFPNKSGTWDIRFYQEIAVNRVLESIAVHKDRILLTLS